MTDTPIPPEASGDAQSTPLAPEAPKRAGTILGRLATAVREPNGFAVVLSVALLFGPACAPALQPVAPGPIPATTSDGVTVYGEPYLGGLDAAAPLVLLFHQGGSNGRGEYGPLAPWLNQAGFRAVAWDQRSGGDTYGASNRTVAALADGTPDGYCHAYADLQAALDAVTARGLADRVFVWGSSYSAALVFRLAAENPDRVAGALAFSPASGGPLTDCRARMWAGEIDAPVLVLRPASEMARASSVEQRDLLTAAGADFRVVENGVHGSSMLVDARTEADMGAARAAVLGWLREAARRDRE